MNIIFTSRYGVKALTGIENLKLKKVYCVENQMPKQL